MTSAGPIYPPSGGRERSAKPFRNSRGQVVSERPLYPTLHGDRLNQRFAWGFQHTWWPRWIVPIGNYVLCGLMGCDRTLMYISADWNEDGTYDCSNCSRRYPVPDSLYKAERRTEGVAEPSRAGDPGTAADVDAGGQS